MKKIDEITFSQEELIYMLRALNLPDLAGMGDYPWGHIPQEQALLVMETVGRGLVARRIACLAPTQMEIDSDVARLLSYCAYPRQMTVLIHDQDKSAIHRYYFRGRNYDVEHTLPNQWIHHFRIIKKSDLGLGLTQSLIKDFPTSENSTVFPIQQVSLDGARRLAINDYSSAVILLNELGLTHPLDEKLAAVLNKPKTKIFLQTVYDFGKKIQQNVISVLADDTSCWVVITGKPADPIVQVMQVDSKKLNQIILAAFQPTTR